MEHFTKQRGSDCAALAFSNLALACGFFFFLNEDKHEEFYELGKSESCRESYENDAMISFKHFFNEKFFEFFTVTTLPSLPRNITIRNIGSNPGAYNVQDLLSELQKNQAPQLLSIKIVTQPGKKNFAHRVAYVPDDEGNYHIIDQAVIVYNYTNERIEQRYIDRDKGSEQSAVYWWKVEKRQTNEEDKSLSYFEYSRKYGNPENMERFIKLREALMETIKRFPLTPDAKEVLQDTLQLNIRSAMKLISKIENDEFPTENHLKKFLRRLVKTEELPGKMRQVIDNPQKTARESVISEIRKLIQEYDPNLSPKDLKDVRDRILPELKTYVDVTSQGIPPKKLTYDDTEAGPSKRARPNPPRASGERQPRPYTRGPFTLIDDEDFTIGPYTLIDDDPDPPLIDPEGGVDRRLRYVTSNYYIDPTDMRTRSQLHDSGGGLDRRLGSNKYRVGGRYTPYNYPKEEQFVWDHATFTPEVFLDLVDNVTDRAGVMDLIVTGREQGLDIPTFFEQILDRRLGVRQRPIVNQWASDNQALAVALYRMDMIVNGLSDYLDFMMEDDEE